MKASHMTALQYYWSLGPCRTTGASRIGCSTVGCCCCCMLLLTTICMDNDLFLFLLLAIRYLWFCIYPFWSRWFLDAMHTLVFSIFAGCVIVWHPSACLGVLVSSLLLVKKERKLLHASAVVVLPPFLDNSHLWLYYSYFNQITIFKIFSYGCVTENTLVTLYIYKYLHIYLQIKCQSLNRKIKVSNYLGTEGDI